MTFLSKQKWILIACILGLVPLHSTLANAGSTGPGTDGGGNAYSSTPENVAAVVSKLKDEILIGLISQAQTRQILNPNYVYDNDLKQLLSQFYAGVEQKVSGLALFNDAAVTRYNPRDKCDPQNRKDASTAHKNNADICFNINLLSRIPADQLEIEIATLALHELAHHFGANEEVAYKFQNYMKDFVKEFFQLRKGFSYDHNQMKHVELRPEGFTSITSRAGRILVKCVKNGTSIGAVDKNELTTLILPGQSTLMGSTNGVTRIQCSNYPAVDCSIKGSITKYVAIGDAGDWSPMSAPAEERLLHLQQTGVCKKAPNRANDVIEGNPPVESAN